MRIKEMLEMAVDFYDSYDPQSDAEKLRYICIWADTYLTNSDREKFKEFVHAKIAPWSTLGMHHHHLTDPIWNKPYVCARQPEFKAIRRKYLMEWITECEREGL